MRRGCKTISVLPVTFLVSKLLQARLNVTTEPFGVRHWQELSCFFVHINEEAHDTTTPALSPQCFELICWCAGDSPCCWLVTQLSTLSRQHHL